MENFDKLYKIVTELREKCPWDKQQTFDSLSTLTIEETYELVDSIRNKDFKGIKEEIGDLFLHLIFYTILLEEKKESNINEVLIYITEKLISRHPHIYKEPKSLSSEEVLKNWENLKLNEGRKSIFEGVPSSLPSLIKAIRIQEKANKVGFDWEIIKDVKNKIIEELNELDEAIELNNKDNIEEELGDLLFSIINLSRHLKVDADIALQKTNQKFIDRIKYIENNSNTSLNEMSLDKLEEKWKEAKQNLK